MVITIVFLFKPVFLLVYRYSTSFEYVNQKLAKSV